MLPIGIILTLVAFIAALRMAQFVIRHAKRLGLVAAVTERSSHVAPTPTGGGIAIALGGTIAALPFVVSGPSLGIPVLAAGLGMAAVGYVDDRRGLAPRYKLGAQLLLAAVAAGLVPLEPVAASLGLALPDGLLFVIVLLGVALWINLFNFMDGIDGLAGGEALVVLVGAAGLVALGHPEAIDAPLLWWMIGVGAAAGGFLVLNWAPARLFMGDTGSIYLGLMIAIFALATLSVGWLTPWQWVILTGLFLADSLATLGRRALRRQPVWQAHRQHAYQHLALRWRRHDRVTQLYLAIDVALLLPLAWLAGIWPEAGWAIAALTLAALVALAIVAGAGSGEHPDEDGIRADDGQ